MRPQARLLILSALFLSLSLTGCLDWFHFAFMNSIPFRKTEDSKKPIFVYLGLDGVSHQTILEAQKKGAFSGPEWKLSKFISPFPGTSDYSWTRILRSKPIPGYELEYYDPDANELKNPGMMGILSHLLPPLVSGLGYHPSYMNVFDFWVSGYGHPTDVYTNTHVALSDSLDNLFLLLEGRSITHSVFSAYLLEYDVLGHIHNQAEVIERLLDLNRRIEKFRTTHSERPIYFTLLSDHGMDFTGVSAENLLELNHELPKVGIKSVKSLRGGSPETEILAVPVLHTLVNYVAVHTLPEQREEVARRTSQLPSVDLTVSRLAAKFMTRAAQAACPACEWLGAFSEGEIVLSFGFDGTTHRYLLPRSPHYPRMGLNPPFQGKTEVLWATDDELFQTTRHSIYPDLFYRIRTSMSPVGITLPADVIVSFKPAYASRGFRLPMDPGYITSAGFHGSLLAEASTGILLSNERELPDAVRSESFLDLFPRMVEHIGTLDPQHFHSH